MNFTPAKGWWSSERHEKGIKGELAEEGEEEVEVEEKRKRKSLLTLLCFLSVGAFTAKQYDFQNVSHHSVSRKSGLAKDKKEKKKKDQVQTDPLRTILFLLPHLLFFLLSSSSSSSSPPPPVLRLLLLLHLFLFIFSLFLPSLLRSPKDSPKSPVSVSKRNRSDSRSSTRATPSRSTSTVQCLHHQRQTMAL